MLPQGDRAGRANLVPIGDSRWNKKIVWGVVFVAREEGGPSGWGSGPETVGGFRRTLEQSERSKRARPSTLRRGITRRAARGKGGTIWEAAGER